jgi:hypothetical protein
MGSATHFRTTSAAGFAGGVLRENALLTQIATRLALPTTPGNAGG